MKKTFLNIIHYILRWCAKRVIKKFDPFVIAITGSVGKTSTKEAVYKVVSAKYPGWVWKTHSSLNAEIGLPLTVLGYQKLPKNILWPIFLVGAIIRSLTIKKYPKYLILEMGVEHVGDIAYLTSIARPNIAIVTSTSGAHLANFKDLAEYRTEKLSIFDNLREPAIAFINGDEDLPSNMAAEIVKRGVCTVGIKNSSANYLASITGISLSGMEFRISCTGYKIAVKSKLLGPQMVYPSLFAFALADKLGISLLSVGKFLEDLEPMPGRMRLIEGRRETLIIDDTYNANPTSVRAALDFLAEVPGKRRRVAILGSMNELGPIEDNAHREIGKYAAEKCDLAVFVGKNAELMLAAHGNSRACLAFSHRSELASALDKIINSGDLILVKASQNNNYLEEIVKKLMKDQALAQKLLVRQSSWWLRKKRA